MPEFFGHPIVFHSQIKQDQEDRILLSICNKPVWRFIIVTTVSTVLMIGCGKREEATGAAPSKPDRVVPVEAITAQLEELTVTKTFTGSLEGAKQANIIAKISERVVSIPVKVGVMLAAGSVVIELDKGGASSQYLQAEANYANSKKNLERMTVLLGDGAISQQVLDGAQTAFDVAKANFEAAKSMVVLTTPIAGSVTAININPGDFVIPGSILAIVADVGEMKVVFNMNESDVSDLALGQSVRISSGSRDSASVVGTIREFFKSADLKSRTFEIHALFQNTPDHWFKPGMFVKVKYQSKAEVKPLVIPNQAILSDGMTSRVFVIRSSRAFQVPVVTGMSDGIKTAIVSGLSENDSVVTVGWNNLSDSTHVSVQNPGR